VLAGLASLFVLQNIAPVDINFLFWSARLSLALLILLVLLAGFLIGWLLQSYLRYRRKQS